MKSVYWLNFLFVLLIVCAACSKEAEREKPAAPVVKDVIYYYSAAFQAYEQKDFGAFLANMREVAKVRKKNPRVMYNLAVAYTLFNQPDSAIILLEKIAAAGLAYPTATDNDFRALKELPAFQEVIKKFEINREPVGSSSMAFRIEEKGLIHEGIAFDQYGENFYVSSVRERKIFQVLAGEKSLRFSKIDDGLWGVFGMKVDANRRILWVCTGTVPEMAGFNSNAKKQTGLFKYDLEEEKITGKYLLEDSGEHLFGDLALAANGDVYLSDSFSPSIYRLQNGADSLEIFIQDERWGSPQGITFSTDENYLFIADYLSNIYRIDLNSREILELPHPENAIVSGIDGLYFHKGDLLAIQNGVLPHRIIRVHLTETLDEISNVSVLEANNPLFNEPTLGVPVGNIFYFVANSQWGSTLDAEGKQLPDEKLQFARIMKMRLW